MKSTRKFQLAIAALGFLSTASVNATVIDLYQSFPAHQGDNGFYVYGWNGSMQPLNNPADYTFNRPGDQWSNPNVFKEIGSWLGAPWIFMGPAGTLSNLGPSDAVLAYQAPIAATYRLDGAFYLYPQSLNGAYAMILDNQYAPIWQSYLSPGGEVVFDNVNISLNAGDRLYYLTDAYNNMGFSEYDDWTNLRGTITYSAPDPASVPEPAAISLLVSGMLGLLLSRRNRRTQA